MTRITKISKIEAAKRQIETAIKMYFSKMDIVSIHTLTCAAHEILAGMCKKQGEKSFLLDDMKKNIKLNKQDEFIAMLNVPRNYFKHLSPNPDKELKFPAVVTDFFLYDACLMYEKLAEKETKFMKIFIMWFIFKHSDILNKPEHQFLAKKKLAKYKSRQDFFEKMSAILI